MFLSNKLDDVKRLEEQAERAKKAEIEIKELQKKHELEKEEFEKKLEAFKRQPAPTPIVIEVAPSKAEQPQPEKQPEIQFEQKDDLHMFMAFLTSTLNQQVKVFSFCDFLRF